MTYQQSLDYIHSLSKFAEKKGHDNINKILERLGNPQDKLKFIHIAGTNGKGSVAAFVSSILIEQGLRVGTFISPFIERFNERIQINKNPIDDNVLISYTQQIKEICDDLPDTNPLEFEVITSMGFQYFKDEKCDVVVLETGLGGRLDSTNVIKNPSVEVFCQIGLDHTEILGDTIEKIAFEKAGIIKPRSKVVFYPDNPIQAYDVIKKVCEEKNCQLIIPDTDRLFISDTTLSGSTVTYNGEDLHIPLAGKHQVLNGICAVETVRAFSDDISYDVIAKGISQTKWPCRFEVMGSNNNIILDGAHNYPGILSLKNTICDVIKDKKLIFVTGMLNDKEYKKSYDEILPLCDKLIVTSVPSLRQKNTEEIFSYAKGIKSNAEYIEDNFEAVRKAVSLMDDDSILCVFGSLYLVGNLRGFVDKM